jgi:hypothetical protein
VSVVTNQARRRWAVVAAGVAVLLGLPAVVSAAERARPGAPVPSASVLVQRARASSRVAFSGLAESVGALGLPDLPNIGDVGARLGGSTRTRVWWARADSWRVDVLNSTGEQGIYDRHGQLVRWDYEQARLVSVLAPVVGTAPVRLPRADDLLPPQAARRLLAGLGPSDQVQGLPGRRRVAGRAAAGVRIVPGDRRSTIGHVDLWLDPGSGLPLAVDVIDLHGVTALRSAFTQLAFGAPKDSVLRIPKAPGVAHDVTSEPDLASRLDLFVGGRLPDRLAGLDASAPVVGGTATYGTGLVRFVVLPLPGRLADQVFDAARSGGAGELALTRGQAVLFSSGLVDLVAVRGDYGHAYLITGLVDGQVLSSAAQELLEQPDGWLE